MKNYKVWEKIEPNRIEVDGSKPWSIDPIYSSFYALLDFYPWFLLTTLLVGRDPYCHIDILHAREIYI